MQGDEEGMVRKTVVLQKQRETVAVSDGVTCIEAELTLESRATDFSPRHSSTTPEVGTNSFFNIFYFLPGFSQGQDACIFLDLF